MLDKLVKEHIILGVDPGTLFMGYALLHTIGSKVEILDVGVFDVHELRLDSEDGGMILVDNLLQEEELLLQAGILVVELVDIKDAEVKDLDLATDGMQQSISHE